MFRPVIGVLALILPLSSPSATHAARPQDAPTATGAALYQTYCVACHGKSGRGGGPLAAQLATRPPDLTTLSRRSGGSFPFDAVYRAIDGRRPVKEHGPMPAWSEALDGRGRAGDQASNRDRITKLTEFVASIQAKPATPAAPRRALCVLSNPAFAGRCTETGELGSTSTPTAACGEILACLNRVDCVRTYCSATTVRQGWRLDSARAIVLEP